VLHTHRAPGALLLVAVAVLALPACHKSKKPAAAKTPTSTPSPSPTKPPDIHADFHPDSVAAVDSQNRPSSNNVAIDASKKVIALIDSYYDIGFLVPDRWGGGSYPDLTGLFSDDAKAAVGSNLQIMALGSLPSQLTRVVPNVQQAGALRVLVEPNLTASYAAVLTHFDGTGQLSAAAGGQSVHIVHDMTIMVDVAANKIIAFEATNSIDSVAKSASYLPPSSPALAALGAQ
jgi:hypothetical protein